MQTRSHFELSSAVLHIKVVEKGETLLFKPNGFRALMCCKVSKSSFKSKQPGFFNKLRLEVLGEGLLTPLLPHVVFIATFFSLCRE